VPTGRAPELRYINAGAPRAGLNRMVGIRMDRSEVIAAMAAPMRAAVTGGDAVPSPAVASIE
jgi:hypothetical protein